jgi:hypothetical protein
MKVAQRDACGEHLQSGFHQLQVVHAVREVVLLC